ncbi:hypothetical protein [Nonomuraea salmonea]|uniref:hypothetical protein n=1 Tax=Nonomuraea salmonea TaxID=46181 RepID=UPI003CD05E77
MHRSSAAVPVSPRSSTCVTAPVESYERRVSISRRPPVLSFARLRTLAVSSRYASSPPPSAVGPDSHGSLIVPDCSWPPGPSRYRVSRSKPWSRQWSCTLVPWESVTYAVRVPVGCLSPCRPRKNRCSVAIRRSGSSPRVT